MLRLITRAEIGRVCVKCATNPGDDAPLGALLLAGWRVLRTGALLCPPCAHRADCASLGHLPTVPTPCGCATGTDHPRTVTGRCAVVLHVCHRCGESTTPPRSVASASVKAVA